MIERLDWSDGCSDDWSLPLATTSGFPGTAQEIDLPPSFKFPDFQHQNTHFESLYLIIVCQRVLALLLLHTTTTHLFHLRARPVETRWPILLQVARHETTVTNVQSARLRMCHPSSHFLYLQCCAADPTIFLFDFCQTLLRLRHARRLKH